MIFLILITISFILLKKIIEKSKRVYSARNVYKNRDKILTYLHEGRTYPRRPKHHIGIREFLLGLKETIGGDEAEKLRGLYTYWGYFRKDKKRLKSIFYRKRLESLNRLMKMKFRLREDELVFLLNDRHNSIRWMSMEYYVLLFKEKSLIQLLTFLQHKENVAHRGVLYHLLASYARINSKDIAFLVEHAPNNELLEVLMNVLEVYPAHGIIDILLKRVNEKSSLRDLISVVKIYGNFPDDQFFNFLELLFNHENWRIRNLVAYNLRKCKGPKVYKFLRALSVDNVYLVRTTACESLLALNDLDAAEILSEIESKKKHPSHRFLNNVLKLEYFKEKKNA